MEGHVRIRINFKSNKFLQVVFFDMIVHTAVCPGDCSHGASMFLAWSSKSDSCEFCLFPLKYFRAENWNTS